MILFVRIVLFFLSPFQGVLKWALTFIFTYVFAYRKKIIQTNLINSFPHKTQTEINAITKKYYAFLARLFIETLFNLHYSSFEILKRCQISKQAEELFNNYYQNNQSVIIVMGHFGNWELGGQAFTLALKHQLNVIYHPIKNKLFNDFMVYTREKFGTKVIAMNVVFKEMLRRKNKINATAFIADQSPPPEGAVWCNFLNQDTPFFRGVGVLAKKLNLPVIYVSIETTGVKTYNLNAELLTPKNTTYTADEMVVLFANRLEQDIKKSPEHWIWSHNRWKHKKLKSEQ